MSCGVAILFDEDPGGLIRHSKLKKDLAVTVVDVFEGEAMSRYEVGHQLGTAIPRHAKYGDPVEIVALCAFDRRRFKIASDSTGSPKP